MHLAAFRYVVIGREYKSDEMVSTDEDGGSTVYNIHKLCIGIECAESEEVDRAPKNSFRILEQRAFPSKWHSYNPSLCCDWVIIRKYS
jgi:hypothetical protein